MNTRSGWLHRTRDYLKQDISGRKYFKIHKNIHNIELSPKSSTPINIYKQESPSNNERIPLKVEKLIRPDRMTPEIGRVLKQKDSEIRNLRKLYHEVSSKVKDLEKTKNQDISLPIVPSATAKKNLWPETKLGGSMLASPTMIERNKSTQNYQAKKILDFPLFKQIRFTKSRPKIVFSNPITGVPLNF